jgi:hypothetical protein
MKPFLFHSKFLHAFPLVCVLFSTPLHGGLPTRKVIISPEIPFGFVLGQTTLEDAGTAWNANNIKILARGNASFGAGSGVDYLGNSRNDKQYLVDISNAEFEGTYNIRFSFYENVLYSLAIKFTSNLQKKLPQAKKFDIEEIQNLEKALRIKYGLPTHSEKDMLAGKSPNILAWDFSGNRLLLYYGIDMQLSYFNIKLAKLSEEYRKKLLTTQIHENQKKELP